MSDGDRVGEQDVCVDFGYPVNRTAGFRFRRADNDDANWFLPETWRKGERGSWCQICERICTDSWVFETSIDGQWGERWRLCDSCLGKLATAVLQEARP